VDYKEKWRLDLLTEPNAVSVPPKAWLKYFELETQELKSRGLLIDQKISILDLKNLAESDVSNRVLFVATMMWGRGPKNGRLMPKFRKVCSSPVFEETLHKTRDLITVGNPVAPIGRGLTLEFQGFANHSSQSGSSFVVLPREDLCFGRLFLMVEFGDLFLQSVGLARSRGGRNIEKTQLGPTGRIYIQ